MLFSITFKSFSSKSGRCKTFHNRKPMISGRWHSLFFEGCDLTVDMSWKPLPALSTSPLDGNVISLCSSNPMRMDKTSFGALSISSMSTHFPSLTAVVKTPFFHSKVPGFVPEVYVPNRVFESVC